MAENHIDSKAFHLAELRSERVRIFGLLLFLAVVVVVTSVRIFLLHTTLFTKHSAWNLALIAAVAAYEFLMLRLVNRAIRIGHAFPSALWILTTILESALPAVGVAWLTSTGFESAYRPLASPATLLFFVFIILSILRLNRWNCWLSGIAAAVSYLGAAIYLGWHLPTIGVPSPVTQTDVSLYAVILLVAGFVAGGVAQEIRKHVEAAIREAETKRKLDQLHHDMQVARGIQQALLPQAPPRLPGFAIAGWNKPADDTGGDFYDWSTAPDGRLIVTLADVTGHGLGPALLAGVCRAYARTNLRVNPSLLLAFTAINDSLSHDLGPERFVTLVTVVCRPSTGRVEMLSAGHGPLLYYAAKSDTFIEVDSQGLPFGIVPDFISEDPTELEMQVGDLFILTTDGFVEWENGEGELYGKRRLEEAIRTARNLEPAQLLESIHQSVVTFSGGTPQMDDLTAVIIKRI